MCAYISDEIPVKRRRRSCLCRIMWDSLFGISDLKYKHTKCCKHYPPEDKCTACKYLVNKCRRLELLRLELPLFA